MENLIEPEEFATNVNIIQYILKCMSYINIFECFNSLMYIMSMIYNKYRFDIVDYDFLLFKKGMRGMNKDILNTKNEFNILKRNVFYSLNDINEIKNEIVKLDDKLDTLISILSKSKDTNTTEL